MWVGRLSDSERTNRSGSPTAQKRRFGSNTAFPRAGRCRSAGSASHYIVDGRGAIGAVVVQHYQNPQQYDESHQRLLEAIAKQIAGAIELVGQREREDAGHRRDQLLNKSQNALA